MDEKIIKEIKSLEKYLGFEIRKKSISLKSEQPYNEAFSYSLCQKFYRKEKELKKCIEHSKKILHKLLSKKNRSLYKEKIEHFYSLIGNMYYLLGDFNNSAGFFMKCLSFNKDDLSHWIELLFSLRALGEIDLFEKGIFNFKELCIAWKNDSDQQLTQRKVVQLINNLQKKISDKNKKQQKIKLLTAPYKTYNQFLPPVALGIISQYFLDNNIFHGKDDLYVKLHHEQKKSNINLNFTEQEIKNFEDYIKGKESKKAETIISKIADLTDFKDYGILLFSATPPAGGDIPNHLLPLALFRFLKKKYNPLIITNNPKLNKKDLNLVDKVIENIPDLIGYLKNKFDFKIQKEIGIKQNLENLPLKLYSYDDVLVAGYYFFDGCPHKCAFCDRYFMKKEKNPQKGVTLPNINNIISQIREFKDKYSINNFMFLNSTINPTEEFASKIAKDLIDNNLNIKWCDCANFKNMTIELLDLLKKSGCVKLVFGFETASKRLQRRINKEIDLNHAQKIIKHCYDIGIWADITLLCGLPYETYEDIYETLIFIKKNYKYLRGINLNRYMTKCNDFFFNAEKHRLVIKKIEHSYTSYGFDEIDGMAWEEKWRYTEQVYNDIIFSLDPARVDYLRPVNHIFRIFASNLSIEKVNNYIDYHFLNNDTKKLEKLIEKYKTKILSQNATNI